MVLVSHLYKFIYFKNYKVASSSVESFFGQFCVEPSTKSSYTFQDNHCGMITTYGISGHGIPINNQNIPYNIHLNLSLWLNHRSAADIKEMVGGDIFNTYIKFCVVRNPYDSMVSSYYWDKNKFNISCDFKEYCKTYHTRMIKEYTIYTYTEWIEWYNRNNLNRLLINNDPVCNYYIRYENLKEDIIILLHKLGITEYDINALPTHKSNIRPKDDHYQYYYDDETREIVYHLFKKEFELFNYTF
jgi:hypothetical protein